MNKSEADCEFLIYIHNHISLRVVGKSLICLLNT